MPPPSPLEKSYTPPWPYSEEYTLRLSQKRNKPTPTFGDSLCPGMFACAHRARRRGRSEFATGATFAAATADPRECATAATAATLNSFAWPGVESTGSGGEGAPAAASWQCAESGSVWGGFSGFSSVAAAAAYRYTRARES